MQIGYIQEVILYLFGITFISIISLIFPFILQVFDVLYGGALKYDDLYSSLILLLSAGSQFDALRREEHKNATPVVSSRSVYLIASALTRVCRGPLDMKELFAVFCPYPFLCQELSNL